MLLLHEISFTSGHLQNVGKSFYAYNRSNARLVAKPGKVTNNVAFWSPVYYYIYITVILYDSILYVSSYTYNSHR